jgi:nucleoside phosphorylase
MHRRRPRHIDAMEAAYIDLMLKDRDSEGRKYGLQRLCKLYRAGLILRNPEPIETVLIGLLHDISPKVRRWAMVGLGLIGNERATTPIIEALTRYRNDPDAIGAGVAALSSLVLPEKLIGVLEREQLPMEGVVLFAAAQHSDVAKQSLMTHKLDIYRATPDELRFATLLVGMDKAPENLFSPKYPNSDIVGILNTHDDPLVVQYSIWAICENSQLNFSNLRTRMPDIEKQPPNVRGWLYKLISADASTAMKHRDYIVFGSEDSSHEAREGLADGIRQLYFDSLDTITLDWLPDEEIIPIRQRLIEHMAKNADRSKKYWRPVIDEYASSDTGSLTRVRIDSAAKQTELFIELRKIALDVDNKDLFASTSERPANTTKPRQKMANTSRKEEEKIKQMALGTKILLVSALPKETAAVKATFDRIKSIGIANDPHLYTLGTFTSEGGERHVILAASGMGKENASVLAANALRTFTNVEFIVMVGIAGGCPNPKSIDDHVRLGDVVVSDITGIISYDFIKETNDAREIRSSPQKPSAKLLNIFNDMRSNEFLGKRPWEGIIDSAKCVLGKEFERPDDNHDMLFDGDQLIPHPHDGKRVTGYPRIFGGGIATADTLQKNPETRNYLRDNFKIKAVEMESSGIQSGAWAQGKDIFVIRGICDYCDSNKNDTWQEYSALVAAAYARAIVDSIPESWLD